MLIKCNEKNTDNVKSISKSHGPDRDGSQDASQTVYGIYPCGGRYDEGDHIKVNASSGTGAAPFRFLTYADRLFIEAELIQAGVITGDAHVHLSDYGIGLFAEVDNLVCIFYLIFINQVVGSKKVRRLFQPVSRYFP